MHAGPGIVRNRGLGIRNVFGMRGIGLGQDDGYYGDDGTVAPQIYGDDGTLFNIPLAPVTTPITTDFSSLVNSLPLTTTQEDLTQTLIDNAELSPNQIASAAAASGGTLSAAQIAQIIGSSATAATGIYKATSTPSLVAGTGLVYNPATGQLVGATTGAQVAGSLAASITGLLPLLLVVGAAFLILPMLEKR